MYEILGDFKLCAGLGTNFFRHLVYKHSNIDSSKSMFYCKHTNEYCFSKTCYDITNNKFITLDDQTTFGGGKRVYLYPETFEVYQKITKMGLIKQLCGVKLVNYYILRENLDPLETMLNLSKFVKEVQIINKQYGITLTPFSSMGVKILKYNHKNVETSLRNLCKKHLSAYDINQYQHLIDTLQEAIDNETGEYHIINYSDFVEKQNPSGTIFDNYLDLVKEYNDKNDDIISKWDKFINDK